jgi:hypothetical protein
MYSDNTAFNKDPRDYALALIEDGLVSIEVLLQCALGAMSHDDVRDMLDANELSPRFSSDYNEDEDDGQPDEAQEWADFDADC